MKLVIMQYAKMIPGMTEEDLSSYWDTICKEKLGTSEYKYVLDDGSYTGEKLDALVDDADAVLGIVIKDNMLDDNFFKKHPNLKYIGTLSHGFGYFDKKVLEKYGVTVTNTIYGNTTIAQYAMALLMDICHGVTENDYYVKKTYWTDPDCPPFVKSMRKQIELYGKTIGIIGVGAIGRQLALMAHGFGMKVVGYDKFYKPEGEYSFIEMKGFDELLSCSDVISIHCPLNSETEGIINKDTISKMKDGVIFINTARGRLVDENDLLEALNTRKVYMAGLDVLCEEPPKSPTGLMLSPYAKVTGHIAWMTEESVYRAIDLGVENYKSYLEGNPKSVIS